MCIIHLISFVVFVQVALRQYNIDRYSVNVQFTIYDESKENGEYVRDVEYWVVLVNNKFYIYADNTLNDIYILEKDLEN